MKITPEMLAGNTERSHQCALFAWAALTGDPRLKWLHAIPNANSQNQVAEGVRAGVADVFLPYPKYANLPQPSIYCAGLYIELKLEKRRKEKNGGLSEAQIEFGKYAIDAGYQWYICYGWEEAKQRIEEYLNNG